MRKAEKRRLGEEKAKREAEQRRQDGLATQKAGREARLRSEATPKVPSWKTKQAERNEFFSRGINPSTGLLFTDAEMAEMEKKANTPARRHLFERIQAGRAGALNEQPPLGDIDDYLEPLPDITVGEFREMQDKLWEGWNKQIADQARSMNRNGYTPNEIEESLSVTPPKIMETQSALRMFAQPEN